MRTAEIVTDAGRAYIKAMGNPEGPHALACEYVGTQLARWFGLRTFDFALMSIGEMDEIQLHEGHFAVPGPAFITRAEEGDNWSGREDVLRRVHNLEMIPKLVVFDTWTRNCDRHPPDTTKRRPNYDNVFLSGERAPAGRFEIVAMDHTHCFTCGKSLNERIATIERIKDERVFACFPDLSQPLGPRGIWWSAGLNNSAA